MSERYVVEQEKVYGLNRYMTKCFVTMAVGLLLTAAVGYGSYVSGLWRIMYTNVFTMWAAIILELAIVVVFSARLHKMSVFAAYACFFIYSVVSGYTMASLGVSYDLTSIGLAFGFTAILFINLAIIGLTTKKDLTQYGSLLFAGLLTLLVVSIIGAIMNIAVLDMIVCYVGIAIFLCLTAYDVQVLRRNYYACENDVELQSKMNIYSALELYLDFVNIFLYVLRIVGNRD